MSLARGQMRDASGAMVLCTGTGPISVVIGADGEPMGPMPICPDCAFSFLELASAEPQPGEMVLSGQKVFFAIVMVNLTGQSLVKARARGPPLVA